VTPIPALLDALLRAGAPSGYEGPATRVWRTAASFAELSGDGIGSAIARVGDAPPLLAVVGHIDEIGLVVTHVDEQGSLWFAPIGMWDAQILVGQRVAVRGSEGPVPGVVGRKPIHMLDDEGKRRAVELKDLHIDIGAASRDEAGRLVRVGDPVVIAAEPMRLAGDRVASRAMDNRLGAYVALESLRRCAEGTGPDGSFAAVASVQEETGLLGARTAAFALRPDLAIAVDVCPATGVAGADEKAGSHPLGSGPIIGRGPTLSAAISELLVETAEREGIAHSIRAYGCEPPNWSTMADADALQISRSGIPTGIVSIPLRYMHSPVEMVDLRDVEATVALLTAFASRVGPDSLTLSTEER
jgi:putative aminopeptidase FrvX